MTINVQLRRDTVTVVPASLAERALEAGEDVNVMSFPGAVVVVYPDGATVEEIERLTAAARAS